MSAAKCLVYAMMMLAAGACVASAQERIKMCGRDLIRLAVSSCGNARLRRSIPDLVLDQHQYMQQWNLDASTEEHQAAEVVRTPAGSAGKEEASAAPHWYRVSSRIRRAAGKISDICCERGCSMKELIQFC
ncbi:insulin-like 3 (Leydig cell) [Betta splendens]|uniref:Insulin-like 3 n=1 Tax=Betta splendens TaxID=158456 RepID=A0A6P7L2R1_BETSP|nr:insulin-like 3 (Leydig cell) [Betta splendens]